MPKQPADVDGNVVALADILSLWIGSTLLTEPNRRAGFNECLAYLRDEYAKRGSASASAITEYVRQRVEEPLEQMAALLARTKPDA